MAVRSSYEAMTDAPQKMQDEGQDDMPKIRKQGVLL